MTNINEFLKQENLEKMTNQELMELWGFILSDHVQAYTVDRIKEVINNNKLKVKRQWKK